MESESISCKTFSSFSLRNTGGGSTMVSNSKKKKAWEKAKTVRGKNPDTWRRDSKGNVIRQGSYGTKGEYGWEVDHKKPKSKGGSDSTRNLQALHHEANRKKSDKYPPKKRKKK